MKYIYFSKYEKALSSLAKSLLPYSVATNHLKGMALGSLYDPKTVENLKRSALGPFYDSKSIENLKRSVLGSFVDPKAIENLKRSFMPFSELAKDAQRHAKIKKSITGYSELIRQIKREASIYSDISKSIANYQPTFDSISKQIKTSGWSYINSIQSLYGKVNYLSIYSAPFSLGEAYRYVREEFEKTDRIGEPDVIEFSEKTIEKTKPEVAESKNDILKAEFWISIIFSLILFIASQHFAKMSEDGIQSHMNKLERLIIELPKELMHERDSSTYYVVIRFVNLRSKPSTKKSEILEVLYPNLKVRLIERKSKWIFIEYYDHISDDYKRGWVSKKYLRILNPQKP